jgi:hypothetical protein
MHVHLSLFGGSNLLYEITIMNALKIAAHFMVTFNMFKLALMLIS